MNQLLKSIFFLLFLIGATQVFAQPLYNVSGVIIADKQPVVGAVVQVKGTNQYTITDDKGVFQLNIAVNAPTYTLVISSLGYKTQEKTIVIQKAANSIKLKIVLEEEVTELKEVIVQAEAPIKQVQKAAYNVVAIDAQKLRTVNSNAADILAKVSGVKMRETGGVGAEAQINLNGFTGKHVRTFIDGVPMNAANASFQINNIPAEMIERIEIYKGVVPVAFGSDALGGAVNVVTRKSQHNYGNVSYTFGSFNTHKSTLNIGQRLTDHISVELNAYQNYSDNNYKVFTEYLNLQTSTYSRQKRWFERFHDRYHNEALIGRVNIFKERWADKLSFGLNYNQEYKQLQNANLMQIVYGGKYRTSYTYSSSMEYEKKRILKGLNFYLSGRYDLSTTNNVDEEARQYSWDGSYREKPTRGEAQYQNTVFEGRTAYVTSHLDYLLKEAHSFQFTHTFSDYERITKNQIITPYTLQSDFMRRINQKNISGLSYKFAPSEHWNILGFGKYYNTQVTGPVIISGNGYNAVYQEQTHYTSALGYGLATTYQLLKTLQTKVSYEKSYRLPNDRELFGDGDLEIGDNQLRPEHSNNLNVNISYQPTFNTHSILIEGGFAYRHIKDYIIRNISSAGAGSSKNHGEVLNLGTDFSVRYFYKEQLSVGGNITYMDIRNKERKTATGATSLIYNDRLPNMPYFFGNADATYNFANLIANNDQLSLTYSAFYTKEFYISWQSEGAKLTVPDQLSHDISLTYHTPNKRLSFSIEAKNFTDALLYDNYSLQKAGRAFYTKLSYRFR